MTYSNRIDYGRYLTTNSFSFIGGIKVSMVEILILLFQERGTFYWVPINAIEQTENKLAYQYSLYLPQLGCGPEMSKMQYCTPNSAGLAEN